MVCSIIKFKFDGMEDRGRLNTSPVKMCGKSNENY